MPGEKAGNLALSTGRSRRRGEREQFDREQLTGGQWRAVCHESLATTEIYTHVSPERQREAVELLGG